LGCRLVATRAHQIPFIVDPPMAEAIASWHAISFGREAGISKGDFGRGFFGGDVGFDEGGGM